MSTISVDASAAIAAAAAERDVAYLRAPISGNPAAVRDGIAAIFVSGPHEAAEACRPLLERIAPTVRYTGADEQARVLKLVLQVMIGGTAGLLSEALVLGESVGLDRRQLLETIASSVTGSRFVEYKSEPLLRGDYSSTFTTEMMLKDVELVLDLAGTTDTRLPLTSELRGLLKSACDHGHSEKDFSALLLELKARQACQ